MPEGDTIHHAANRIRPVLEGRVPDEIRTPQRRHAADRWPQRLAGRAVEPRRGARQAPAAAFRRRPGAALAPADDAASWDVRAGGGRWRRSPARAWLVLGAGDREVVQFDGPLLELMTEARSRSDPPLASLGPDVLGERFDEREVLRRLRGDDPTRPFGDALIDQRTIAGLGNIWKSRVLLRRRRGPLEAGRRDRG